MPVINFPSNPSNNELFIAQGKSMRYNAAKNKWNQVGTLTAAQVTEIENKSIGVSSMSVSGNTLVIQKDDSSFANVSLAPFAGNILTNYASASQLPMTNLVSGTQVYVTDTDSLFITDGNGWFKIATVNLSPSFSLGVSSISMNAGGSIDVNYTVNEPEDTPYTVSASATSNATITVHQSNNTISFTAGGSAVSSETITVSATDGINSVGDTLTMTVVLPPWGQATQVFRTANNTSGVSGKMGWSLDLSSTDERLVVGLPASRGNLNSGHSWRPGHVEIYDFNTSNSTWSGPSHNLYIGSQNGQQFGYAVAIYANTVIASAPFRSAHHSNDGSFYVWQLDRYPYPTGGGGQNLNRGANNQLGRKLKMIGDIDFYNNGSYSDGRLVMASSKGAATGLQGEVSFFSRQYVSSGNLTSGNHWNHEGDVQSPDGSHLGGTGAVDFGSDIEMVYKQQGQVNVDFVISDSSYGGNGLSVAGRVYYYRGHGLQIDQWANQSGPSAIIDIPAGHENPSMYFGDSLSLNQSATTLAIGAPGAHNSNLASPFDSGAVFVYTGSYSSWTLQAVLQPADAELYMRFGHSVDLSPDGNTLAIGANQPDNLKGAVYIFERSGSTWSQSGKHLHSPIDGQPNFDSFGHRVALTADTYGAYVASAPGATSNRGEIYGFKKP